MKKKVLLTLFLSLLALSTVFAAGVRELGSNESIVRVVSVTEYANGYSDLRAYKTDGTEAIYHIAPDTVFENTNLNSLEEGDILIVEDTGIATMSIPPQLNAQAIRDITMARNLGFYNEEFSEPVAPPAIEEEELTFNLDDLIDRFSYSYGYLSMDSLMSQGLVVDGRYFAKGILDAIDLRDDTLMTYDEMLLAADEYFANVYQQGITGDAGDAFLDLSILSDLDTPSTLSEEFAYSYGFMISYQIMMQGLQLGREAFPYGMISRLYNSPALLTIDEMYQAIDDYNQYLSEVYDQWLEQLAAENLKDAEEYLAENAKREEVIVITEHLQLEYTSERSEESAMPTEDDIVVVNYTLRDADGNVLETNSDVSFPLSGVISGFRDAILNMHVGESITAYLHPEVAYGEMGAGTIAPNELLIFDIDLISIEE